jgi:hypothetical protein
MNSRAGILLLIAMLGTTIESCTTCRNDVVQEQSNGSGITAIVKTRVCGSVEGWAVSLRSPARDVDEEIFLARMPHPAVLDAPDSVSLSWRSDTELIVSAPAWVSCSRQATRWRGVSIQYVVNAIPYPGVMER